MITEFVLAGLLQFGYIKGTKYLRNLKFKEIKEQYMSTINKHKLPFHIVDAYETEYGFRMISSLTGGNYSDLERLKDELQVSFEGKLEIVQNPNMKTATLYLYKNELNDFNNKFEPYPCKPNEIFISLDDRFEPIIADMNEAPHILNSGTTGSGKGGQLRVMLTNLIATSDEKQVEIYFSNITKTPEFRYFAKCKQTRGYVESVGETIKLLEHLNHIYNKRVKLFNNRDCDNIAEYNAKYNRNPLRYIYLVIDEFAGYFPDDKAEEDYNDKCTSRATLKKMAEQVRKSGIFLIITTQRPDTNSISPSMKCNLTTKICFAQLNNASSLVVADDTSLVGIEKRKFLYISGNKRIWGRSLYITNTMVKEFIKDSMVEERATMKDYNVFLNKTSDNKETAVKEDAGKKSTGKNAIPKPSKIIKGESKDDNSNNNKSRVKNIEVIDTKDCVIENGQICMRIQKLVQG